ncbi:MAG: EamA family transporter [bacterium]
MYIILGLLSALFAALVAIFGKVGIANVDSTLATTVRAVVMCGFFVITATALGKWKGLGSLDNRAWEFLILSGLAGAASWFCYFWALKIGPSSKVAALDRLSIVFTVIFATAFLAEKITWIGWVGAALMGIGAILLVR